MRSRAAILAAHASRRDDVIAIPDLDDTLAQQLADARAAWPGVPLADEDYLRQLAAKLDARVSEPAERVIRTMPAADLYLACACATGDRVALARFRDDVMPALREALAKLAVPAATVDETEQRVSIMLFVGDGAQIRQYSGRGRLRSWVRSIGVRTARRLLGVEQKGGGDELADLPGDLRDPDLELLRAQFAGEVRAALTSSLAELSERQRNVLRQYYVDELTIDQLASLYAINRATAARWVAGARLALVTRTRERLARELALSARDVDSIIRLVRSQLSIDLRITS